MRITGGVFRSRSLTAPRGQETRPTSDRVREALFSMLVSSGLFPEPPAEGPRVLDLYAGSGALGIEALSRGARSLVSVESARPAITAIRENTRALEIDDQVTVLAMRVDRALDELTTEGRLFELVLMDPPYADVRAPGFDALLAKAARLLAASGALVLEHAKSEEPAPPPGLVVDRRRRHGDTALSLFRSAADDATS